MKVGHLPTSFTGFTAPHHATTMFKWGSIPHLVQPISTYSLGICASAHDCQHVSQSPHTLQGRTWSLYGASPLIKKHQNSMIALDPRRRELAGRSKAAIGGIGACTAPAVLGSGLTVLGGSRGAFLASTLAATSTAVCRRISALGLPSGGLGLLLPLSDLLLLPQPRAPPQQVCSQSISATTSSDDFSGFS